MAGSRFPRRIAIVGNAGAGKSTLAVALGRRLALPVHHLDTILWDAGWRIVAEAEFSAEHDRLIAEEAWVIDGIGHPATLERRFAAADTIIYARFPLWRCFLGLLQRRSGDKIGRPAACPAEPPLRRSLAALLRVQRQTIPDLDALADAARGRKRVLIARSRREITRLLEF